MWLQDSILNYYNFSNPTATKQLQIISGLLFKKLYKPTIYCVPKGLTALKQWSTGCFLVFCSNLVQTCLAYHLLNCFLRNSFAAILMLRSKGCNLSLKFGGIRTKSILFKPRNFKWFLIFENYHSKSFKWKFEPLSFLTKIWQNNFVNVLISVVPVLDILFCKV